jgi:hypothetical protein
MNPTLLIRSPRKWQGTVISVLRFPFTIGRGAGCTLRAASTKVGDRHCALLLQDGKVFVEELRGAGDTFIDDEPIQGTVEMFDRQRLRVGPLVLELRLPHDASETLPLPSVDDEAAALLLEDREATDDGWEDVPRHRETDNPATHPGKALTRPQAEDTTEAARNILNKYGELEGLWIPKKKR